MSSCPWLVVDCTGFLPSVSCGSPRYFFLNTLVFILRGNMGAPISLFCYTVLSCSVSFNLCFPRLFWALSSFYLFNFILVISICKHGPKFLLNQKTRCPLYKGFANVFLCFCLCESMSWFCWIITEPLITLRTLLALDHIMLWLMWNRSKPALFYSWLCSY